MGQTGHSHPVSCLDVAFLNLCVACVFMLVSICGHCVFMRVSICGHVCEHSHTSVDCVLVGMCAHACEHTCVFMCVSIGTQVWVCVILLL